MSKQKRIKKIVKSHLDRIQDDGAPLYANKAAKITAEESLGKLSAADLATALGITNPGNTVTETLNIDKDAQPDNLDAFPRDQREVADADDDGLGNNKEIHDAALLILAEHTAAATLFTAIQTKAGNGAGQVDALLTTLANTNEPANHAADGGAYQTAYDAAEDALISLNADILAFKQHAATANTLFDSIKDFTATANVKYETTPGDAATLKLVTLSATEAKRHQADLTNNTPELVAANDPDFANLALMDLATEEAKVTTAVTGFTARLTSETDPSTIPDA